jgi:hypothetical protein
MDLLWSMIMRIVFYVAGMLAALSFLGFACLAVQVALAQQQSPTEQALSTKLIKEINEGLSCSVALSQAQAKIVELEKQLAEARK